MLGPLPACCVARKRHETAGEAAGQIRESGALPFHSFRRASGVRRCLDATAKADYNGREGTLWRCRERKNGAFLEADDGARTHDLLHGKQTLYQLSYIRE
jgi:hypothetical protein